MREARITISDSEYETMGIEGLVSLCQEAGLQDFEELVCRGFGAVVQVEVETRLDEKRLSSLECVDQWEHVAEIDDIQLYVIAFTAPGLPESLAGEMEDLVGTCNPVVNEHGATLSLVGPQEAIAGTVDRYETAGVSPDLRKLDVYEGRERPIDDLTNRQREVIQTAYDNGYYEVPREVTTDDIAGELDIDSSTVAEHLQRAERNLLRHHLGR
ncbi:MULTISPECIES: helix-turn-helix domain-containing protein [Halorussus]|uniref:helix-turn-helix domain-containing protein n=1 Tax=Halorussus TaxID=1070314 RepID=UPI00209F4B6D|nr:helix-turn-helix domain-containing protein [Halorussus vallis]USZ77975.1 helix-turn-helix domain-containing protein [Halorussus vallis]USZ78007.1 helix-turn-helix domain-containing protein [Halorussus vallis]